MGVRPPPSARDFLFKFSSLPLFVSNAILFATQIEVLESCCSSYAASIFNSQTVAFPCFFISQDRACLKTNFIGSKTNMINSS
jgi:hypothetical protein